MPTVRTWRFHGVRNGQPGPRRAYGDVLVDFKVTGEGALIGVGNGDPNCQESDKEPRRSLFSGLAQAIAQSTKTAGTMEIVADVTVRHVTIPPAKIAIQTKQTPLRPTA